MNILMPFVANFCVLFNEYNNNILPFLSTYSPHNDGSFLLSELSRYGTEEMERAVKCAPAAPAETPTAFAPETKRFPTEVTFLFSGEGRGVVTIAPSLRSNER